VPSVSVLMSVYNGADYLRESVDSILNQTFADFEFIIIDDASTDNTPAILDSYPDQRIVRLHNPHNLGLTHSLNRGLAIAQGRYIARHDADDIAHVERLAKQVHFMDAQPDLGLACGHITRINAAGQPTFKKESTNLPRLSPLALRWELLWTNPIMHSTVMLRKSVLDEHQLQYNPNYNGAEDYELWTRLAHLTDLARMPEMLSYYRILSSGVSGSNAIRQKTLTYQIMVREVRAWLEHEFSDAALKTIFETRHFPENEKHRDFRAAVDLLMQTYHQFQHMAHDQETDQQLRQSAGGWLLRLSNRARQYSRREALYPLWRLREISYQEFVIRGATHLYRIVKNSPGIHSWATDKS